MLARPEIALVANLSANRKRSQRSNFFLLAVHEDTVNTRIQIAVRIVSGRSFRLPETVEQVLRGLP